MADSADSTISSPARARSQKRRPSAVSPETENKLARAARSAQRLAQLSDVARDNSTLDLFPEDTTRAEQQAMNIDVRQGTLQGFELPDVVLAAVGATDGAGFAAGSPAATEGKGATRGARGASASKADATGDDPHAGQMVIETEARAPERVIEGGGAAVVQTSAGSLDSDVSAAKATKEASESNDTNAASNANASPPQAASLAAASVVRSVAALRQATSAAPDAGDPQNGKRSAASIAWQRAAAGSLSKPAHQADAAQSSPDAPVHANTANATGRDAQPAPAASYFTPSQTHAPRATPDLDHARATAFADTVDALYGVIADQRRAAGDHSRRMKWMLTIVVCALLMTIAIGIAQTLLLFRLAHQSTAHEQRIEQMMLNQQATLATLLDTDSSTISLPVSAQVSTPAAASAAVPATKPADAHVAHSQHAQRRKSAHPH
jgi:hypothetical protein